MFKNLSWSLVTTLSNILFQFIGLVILSKLITPEEYGIIGTIAIFTNIADLLVDSGMGGALIYKKEATETDFSTLFIYNLLVSLLLYTLLFLIAPLIADFYRIENLRLYIRAYGLIIILIAFSISQDCKLKKKMDFKTLALISIISNVVSLGVAIYGGYKGLGIWALIIQALLFQIIRALCLYIVCGFNKHYRFSFQSFTEQFSFGGWLLLSNVIQSACSNIYANIIPKIGTLTQNGYYTQSAKIGYVPTNTITLTVGAVAFPYLAKSKDVVDLNTKARVINRMLYHVAFPMLALLSTISYEIIEIVLGKQWLGASYYLKILLLSGIGDTVSYMLRNYLKSIGQTRLITRLEIIKSTLKFTLIGLSLFGGLEFLIYSILVSSVVNAFISMIVVSRHSSYSLRESLFDVASPLLFTSIVFAAITIVFAFFGHSLWSLLIVSVTYLLYFCIGALVGNKDIKELLEIAFDKLIRHEKE